MDSRGVVKPVLDISDLNLQLLAPGSSLFHLFLKLSNLISIITLKKF